AVLAEHGFGHREHKLEQPAIGMWIAELDAENVIPHCAGVPPDLIIVEQTIGAMPGGVPSPPAEPWIESLLPPLPDQIEFGDHGRIERAVAGDAVGIAPPQSINDPAQRLRRPRCPNPAGAGAGPAASPLPPR